MARHTKIWPPLITMCNQPGIRINSNSEKMKIFPCVLWISPGIDCARRDPGRSKSFIYLTIELDSGSDEPEYLQKN